ncbi:MAG: hypothetical protein ACI8RD_003971 [Bacillariaceae sp.]|jgi:hypothetical protein
MQFGCPNPTMSKDKNITLAEAKFKKNKDDKL